ncbi:low molecular weight protein-tyrosine-phosphatase [uncultured Bifidobacterium sp.]|uniref:low molecular weight protein-tyrosine-phosphatase n=1 Tax=uncultured Bifidobacterium sp. TaxID=165187 RepID=UPI0026361135|nr:low molecular weight protein-tyrosine-phosphatase [uncultured Bifidobacterium sp.]
MTDDHRYTIMTVCTGNICRSPMAQIVLAKRFADAGMSGKVDVLSSGVSDEEFGHPIDPRAVRVLRGRGYEIPRHHAAHRIDREEIDRTDLFLPMTASHMRALLRMLPPEDRSAVRMYRSFDPSLAADGLGPDERMDLVDPWYGGPHEFNVAINQIDQVAPYIVEWVKNRLG